MTPSPLHGLNIVQPDSPATDRDRYTIADQQDLLTNPPYPDLAAQLDLWTNLTFQTDEPLIDRGRKGRTYEDGSASNLGDDDKEDDAADPEGPASLEGHVNAVNPTAVTNGPVDNRHGQTSAQQFDMAAILAGFGIDPFLVPQVAAAPPPSQAASLAQLLAAYPFPPPPLFTQTPGPLSPPSPAAPIKRQRSRKTSTTASATASTTRSTTSPLERPSSPVDTELGENDGSSVSLNPAEDKRRRNTAASARFRLKKKEREAALERRSHDLESRVNELERECEALRRENGWLKGLVVGVTGAGAGAAPSPSAGAKRKREVDGRTVDVDVEGKKVLAVSTV